VWQSSRDVKKRRGRDGADNDVEEEEKWVGKAGFEARKMGREGPP